jgi:hypothetical protein
VNFIRGASGRPSHFKEHALTEFTAELRHYCRNPKCRSKLKEPAQNLREAFCARGCHSSFYLKRCGVCEVALEQKYRKLKRGDLTKFVKVQSGLTCGSSECKRRWREGDGLGRFWPKPHRGSQAADLHKEAPAAQRVFSASQTPWRRIAGPRLTSDQFRAATVPDGPNNAWEGGPYERIEAQNRALLRAHFRKKAAECLIQPHHPPINIVGGYKFPLPPDLDPKPAITITGDLAGLIDCLIPADLSIPAFLKRAA